MTNEEMAMAQEKAVVVILRVCQRIIHNQT
jgi:hypothetical protein